MLTTLVGLAAACSSRSDTTVKRTPAPSEPAVAATPAPSGEVAYGYFAGGCFWGVEHFLEQLPGVADVESGYMGGAGSAPTYEQVSTGMTGHAEAVRVRFDPQAISYEAVARRFFEIHDPTQADGQGPDLGPQYRSAVFVTGPEQRAIAERLISQLVANGYEVVTQVHDADTFWPAEDYHQDYYVRTGKQPYCHRPVPRFGRPAAEQP